jgi:hypothetical protein
MLNYLTPRHEDIWGSGGIAPPFLASALDGGEWLASRPSRYTAGIHWIRGWVGLRADLGAVEWRNLLPLPGIESRPSTRSRSLYKISWGGEYIWIRSMARCLTNPVLNKIIAQV